MPADRQRRVTAIARGQPPSSLTTQVVVIKFYASWCRACKALAPKFAKVAQDWPELEFCEMLFDDNKKLCKQLGIKVLPYVEVRGAGQDTSRGCVLCVAHPSTPLRSFPARLARWTVSRAGRARSPR